MLSKSPLGSGGPRKKLRGGGGGGGATLHISTNPISRINVFHLRQTG